MPVRILAFLALVQLLYVAAQTSSVVCTSSYVWAQNSLRQNPCVVGAYLLRPCGVTVIDVPVLPAGQHYDPGDNSNCNCNTVVYSLISACADCQLRLFDTWSTWSQNCTAVYRSVYPQDIPLGTAVPAWAYLDVTIANNFNAIAAMSDHAPESTVPSATSPTSFSFGPSFSRPPPPSASSKVQQLNIGAIAGGAVAGVAIIGIVIVVTVWLVTRNRRQARRRAQDIDPNPAVQIPLVAANGTRAALDSTSYVAYTGTTPSPAPMQTLYPMPRLYDPSDPSTFPARADPMIVPPLAVHTPNPQSPSEPSATPSSGYHSNPTLIYTEPQILYPANPAPYSPTGPSPPYSTIPQL